MFGPDFWIYNPNELVNSKLILILEKNDYVIPVPLIYNKIKEKAKEKCYYIDDEKVTHGSLLMEDIYIPTLLNIISNIINKKIEKNH
jgi:hypothetical protein